MKRQTKRRGQVKNNIALCFAFRALGGLGPTDGVWVLFMASKGLALWQIGLLEGVFHVTSLLFEVPSGAMADLLGRRRVLFLSRVMGIASSVVMVLSSSFLPLCAGFVLAALNYNLTSGTEEALLYDSLLQLGREEEYLKTAGRMSFVWETGHAIGMLAGGFLARTSYLLCYLADIVVGAAGGVTSLLMAEPEPSRRETRERVTLAAHFRSSWAVIRDHADVRAILLRYCALFAFYTSAFFYSQELYKGLGFDEAGIGLILLLMGACASAGALLSARIAAHLHGKTRAAGGVLLGVGLLLMGVRRVWLSIVGFGLASMANTMLEPLQSAELNSLIPSAQRATVISVGSMCFSCVMVVLFPAIGALAGRLGLSQTLALLGGGLTAVELLALFLTEC